MIAREYRRVTDSALARLRERSGPRITTWAKRWFADAATVDDVRWNRLVQSEAARDLHHVVIGEMVRACIADDADLFDRLTQMMLSSAEPAGHGQRAAYQMWSRAVALEALADLVNGLFEGFTESDGPHQESPWSRAGSIPSEFTLPGAGALTLELGVASAKIFLHLNGELVAALAPPSKGPALTRSGLPNGHVGSAIAGEAIRLAATTAITTVPLDSLQGLTVGDVVILDHSIDEPLMIRTAPGIVAGTAYLGTTHGHRAVRLTT